MSSPGFGPLLLALGAGLLLVACADQTHDIHDISTRPCVIDGETYLHGELVSDDGCTQCSCQDSVVYCVQEPHGCDSSSSDAGTLGD